MQLPGVGLGFVIAGFGFVVSTAFKSVNSNFHLGEGDSDTEMVSLDASWSVLHKKHLRVVFSYTVWPFST